MCPNVADNEGSFKMDHFILNEPACSDVLNRVYAQIVRMVAKGFSTL